MQNKWIDYGLTLEEVAKFLEYLKLYKVNSSLITITSSNNKFNVIYSSPFKITENSTLLVENTCM